MIDPAQIAIKASTQEHLDIEDIIDDVVVLKDGGACIVLAASAINFGLLSEREQEATILTYAQLINSLSFPLQIAIRSQRKDITAYLKLVEEAEIKEGKKEIKEQIKKYRQFVAETVQKNNVLDKKFYLVIPMSALEIGLTSTLAKTLTRSKKLPFDKAYILEKAKVNLSPKKDHLLRQLNRLGLKGRQLTTAELIKLFFDIYNPESYGQQIAEENPYPEPMVASPIKAASAPAPPTEKNSLQEQINQVVKETSVP
ncbi:MAG: hypothetical protein ABH807_00010 [Candidatus Shapirobacteria bacterium]